MHILFSIYRLLTHINHDIRLSCIQQNQSLFNVFIYVNQHNEIDAEIQSACFCAVGEMVRRKNLVVPLNFAQHYCHMRAIPAKRRELPWQTLNRERAAAHEQIGYLAAFVVQLQKV